MKRPTSWRALTNFPVRNGPRIGHPVGDIGAPVPGALGRRDRVEVGIGGVFGRSKAALLLTDLPAEVREAPLEARHLAAAGGLDGRGGGRAVLLLVDFFVLGHDG